MTDIKRTKDVDGRERVYGWIWLATPEKERRIETARPLWGTMPAKQLALVSGVPYDALRRALEPGYAERRRQQVRDNRNRVDRAGGGRTKADGSPVHLTELRPRDTDVAARLAEIPDDDRTPAQRLMGDPIPSRSALARKLAGVVA